MLSGSIALMTGIAPLQAGGDEEIALRITGEAGASFAAECNLKSADGDTTFSVTQPVPYETRLRGRGLRCRVETSSRIEVEMTKGGNVSRIKSAGGLVLVSIGS